MAKFDIVIRNGMIVDGARNPRYKGDVGIKDGKIARMGRIKPGQATREIEADGLVVAPGFIDLHTHYDAQVFWDPYLTTSGWNGVTSVVVGNCGFGFAPCKKDLQADRILMWRNSLKASTKDLGDAYARCSLARYIPQPPWLTSLLVGEV